MDDNMADTRLVMCMKRGVAMLVLCVAASVAAHEKPCRAHDAEAADAMLDKLNDWAAIDMVRKRYGHCDDGSIAEGYSEAVARLLVDRWDTLPALAQLVRRNPALKRFVLRHVDATLDTKDLDQIAALASRSCPYSAVNLCSALKSSAKAAAR